MIERGAFAGLPAPNTDGNFATSHRSSPLASFAGQGFDFAAADLYFSAVSRVGVDGRWRDMAADVPLCPGGDDLQVKAENATRYAYLLAHHKLNTEVRSGEEKSDELRRK